MIELIVLDLETNGYHGSSVLSACAEKITLEKTPEGFSFDRNDKFLRYYYPVEPYNYGAARVHGLTKPVLAKKRDQVEYPKYFNEDMDSLATFCNNAEIMVAHNIKYDTAFLSFNLPPQLFCTMQTLKAPLQLKTVNNRLKAPKLEEVAKIFGIPYDKNDLHQADGDVDLTVRILIYMSTMPEFKDDFNGMLKIEKDSEPSLFSF